jgi:hypothetical protein
MFAVVCETSVGGGKSIESETEPVKSRKGAEVNSLSEEWKVQRKTRSYFSKLSGVADKVTATKAAWTLGDGTAWPGFKIFCVRTNFAN